MNTLLKNRKTRKISVTILTLAVLLVYVGVSLLSLYLSREKTLFGDMTTEGIYSITDMMTEELADIEGDVTVTFCTDPDYLYDDNDLRPTYVLALQLAARNPHITVQTLNLARDPHAADAYKMTAASEITSDTVIVSYGQKFRTADAEAFYTVGEDSERWSYKGEYQLASMILSVTDILEPCAYFTVGHGEKYFDPDNLEREENAELLSFYYLLLDAGLRVSTVNLDELGATDELPADCVLLIMNGPTTDYGSDAKTSLYTRSAMEKIDRFLEKKRGNMLYFRDSSTPVENLPVLYEYLTEWGFAFDNDILRDPRGDKVIESERTRLTAVYASEDTSSVAHSLYAAISDLPAAPRTVVPNTCSLSISWKDTVEKTYAENISRTVAPLLYSSATTRAYDLNGDLLSDSGDYTIALIGVTAYYSTVSTFSYSYLIAFGTTEILSEQYLGSNAYGNKDVLTAAVRTVTRTDTYAQSDLGSSTDLNSANYGGKIYETDDMVDATSYQYNLNGKKWITETYLGQKNDYRLVRTMVAPQSSDLVCIGILCFIPVLILPIAAFAVIRRRKNR